MLKVPLKAFFPELFLKVEETIDCVATDADDDYNFNDGFCVDQ